MTMKQMQLRLSRAVRDLDAVGSELWCRRFPYDCEKADQARDIIGQICLAFLDEADLEKLDGAIGDVVPRPEPFMIGMPSAANLDEIERLATEKVLKMNKKTRVIRRTVATASGKMTMLELKPRKPAKRKQAA